jgi:hypothetical protein
MTCPYFVDSARCVCLAVDEELIPTIHERTRYCRGQHERCPTFLAREAAGEAIPLNLYETLWYAPAASAGDSIGA